MIENLALSVLMVTFIYLGMLIVEPNYLLIIISGFAALYIVNKVKEKMDIE